MPCCQLCSSLLILKYGTQPAPGWHFFQRTYMLFCLDVISLSLSHYCLQTLLCSELMKSSKSYLNQSSTRELLSLSTEAHNSHRPLMTTPWLQSLSLQSFLHTIASYLFKMAHLYFGILLNLSLVNR